MHGKLKILPSLPQTPILKTSIQIRLCHLQMLLTLFANQCEKKLFILNYVLRTTNDKVKMRNELGRASFDYIDVEYY
jgi:hypothetical protein